MTRAEEIARELHWNGVEDRVRVIADALESYAQEERKAGYNDAYTEMRNACAMNGACFGSQRSNSK